MAKRDLSAGETTRQIQSLAAAAPPPRAKIAEPRDAHAAYARMMSTPEGMQAAIAQDVRANLATELSRTPRRGTRMHDRHYVARKLSNRKR